MERRREKGKECSYRRALVPEEEGLPEGGGPTFGTLLPEIFQSLTCSGKGKIKMKYGGTPSSGGMIKTD